MSNLLRVFRPGATVIRQFYGDSPVTWIDVEDIAAVAEAALLRPAEHAKATYRLGAEAMSMAEVTRTIAEITGMPFTYEAADPARALDVLTKAGMEPTYARSLAAAMMSAARGEYYAGADVNDNVEKVTGRPRTRIRDFVTRHRERIIKAASVPA